MEPTREPNSAAPSPRPRLISKRKLSAELHKSCRTIEIWVKAGYLSCIKVGHSVFFDREQVFADLRRFQVGGPASR
ncbi:MAG: hypothetical protein ACYDC1_02340 [Limisphaerales bacterium]